MRLPFAPGEPYPALRSFAAVDEAERFKAFEAEGWSAQAQTYDRLTGRITAQYFEALLETAGVEAGTRLLDVASGPGHLVAAAADRGAEPVGVDIAEDMVALARRTHPGLEFGPGDAEALPFADGAFDALTAAFVLNHLPRPERAAGEMARVLRPAGRVAVAVWERPEGNPFFGIVDDALARSGVSLPDDAVPTGPDQYRFADDRAFTGLLADAGFEDVRVEKLEAREAVADPYEAWEGLLGGSVRLITRVSALHPTDRHRLLAAFAEVLEDEGHEILSVAKLASGVRPPVPGREPWLPGV
jgi:ubiquinone/menaquinone biosynthesis C-methylase UbiE